MFSIIEISQIVTQVLSAKFKLDPTKMNEKTLLSRLGAKDSDMADIANGIDNALNEKSGFTVDPQVGDGIFVRIHKDISIAGVVRAVDQELELREASRGTPGNLPE